MFQSRFPLLLRDLPQVLPFDLPQLHFSLAKRARPDVYTARMSVNDLLDFVFRWAHLVAGIMWIGNSMLFNWLDRNLVKAAAGEGNPLSQGKIWMVHSGAFYEVEKKLLAPGEMPTPMHWFKWQNGITWLTGISLLVVVYYMNGAAFLVDPQVRALGAQAAISLSVGSLTLGWVVYDLLWRLWGERAPRLLTALSLLLLLLAAYGYTLLFSGRAAYLQTGVLMGTIMTGNVWMRIMPSQRQLIAATQEGRPQDVLLSQRAKQRSIHNNYMTFPLLFIMLSNHFSSLYGHHLRWGLLVLVMVGGSGVRHFMNVRYDRKPWLAPALTMGGLTLLGLMLMTRLHAPTLAPASKEIGFARAQEIIVQRCLSCHSSHPTDAMFPVAPVGVLFDTPERIAAMAPRILERAIITRTMPFLNRTQMTEQERADLSAWIKNGAKLQ